jgi:phage repressor protein C with HTH and peptisase S24 domain
MGRPRKIKSQLASRLIEARGQLSIEKVVENCDVAASTYAGYERGDTTPDAEFIGKFIKLTGADPWRLLTGDTVPANDDLPLDDDAPLPALVDRLELQVSAGPGASGAAAAVERVPFSAQMLRRQSLRPDELAVLEVRGDSMEPVLEDGDMVLVDKAASKPVSGKMYVVARGTDLQIKWVTVMRSGIQLVSENEAYPTERLDPHDAPRFYRVRWFGHFIR